MDKRAFLKSLIGLGPKIALGGLVPAASAVAARRVLVQESPVAGFQYHQGELAWPRLRMGSSLRLQREAENRHDRRAVAVFYGVLKLGYVPRAENVAISQMLDRGETLEASVVRLGAGGNPWARVRFAVAAVVR